MGVDRLSIQGVPFSAEAFGEEVRKASGAPEGSEPSDQVRYLISYLKNPECGARTLLIESPYIDRHYLEEYSGYYASALQVPRPRTTRLHLFSSDWEARGGLPGLFEELAGSEVGAVTSRLQAEYIGFVVIRPLPGAPVGRTVLRPYRNPDKQRCFEPATTRHDVHLLGLTLRVEGMPFQQQDQGVGACATTALWSALARVTRADGGRAVTPLAVTLAATRNLLGSRAFPANKGLEKSQILEAIRHFGYSPDVIDPYGELEVFQLVLKCYIRSGIPVILNLTQQDGLGEHHAITVVGFRENDADEPAAEIEFRQPKKSFGLRSLGLSRIYVHDDRLGPYARMRWEAEAPPKGRKARKRSSTALPRLRFEPREAGYEQFQEPLTVWEGYAPLYPKLRMTATDLVAFASQLLPLMRQLVGPEQRDRLLVELRFILGGRYLEEFHKGGLSRERLRQIVSTLLLPRYVGLIRFKVAKASFVDVVCDTTDIPRSQPEWSSALAFIPFADSHLEALRSFAARYGEAVVL